MVLLDVWTAFIGPFGCAVGEYAGEDPARWCDSDPWVWPLAGAVLVVAGGVLARRLRSWVPLVLGLALGFVGHRAGLET